MRPETAVDDIHAWIALDVKKEQIKSVLWAIMMSNTEDDISYIIKQMRNDYNQQREEVENDKS